MTQAESWTSVPPVSHHGTAGDGPAANSVRPIARLAFKLTAFLALNALLAVVVLKAHEATLDYAPWETDSILLTMPENTHKDLLFLGTSRAYLFSRFQEHHGATESILGRSVFNMALPQGGGIVPARFYLESYFEAGNTADRVVYFLDPFVFYSTGANEDHKFVYFEPFRFGFLAKMIWNGYNYRQIITYVRSKFSRAWFFQKPELLIHHTAHTYAEYVNPGRIQQRFDSLYYQGMPGDVDLQYGQEFANVVATCRANETPLTVVVIPTLLGPEPGHESMMAMLDGMEAMEGIPVHDFVGVMPDYTKYYNLDHMNLGGVEHFMEEFLNPALDGDGGTRGRSGR